MYIHIHIYISNVTIKESSDFIDRIRLFVSGFHELINLVCIDEWVGVMRLRTGGPTMVQSKTHWFFLNSRLTNICFRSVFFFVGYYLKSKWKISGWFGLEFDGSRKCNPQGSKWAHTTQSYSNRLCCDSLLHEIWVWLWWPLTSVTYT